jgi:predicted DsbA family dithiol-disulfide isomerase
MDCGFFPPVYFLSRMNVKIIYYLEVTSSWCYWAEPAWTELKTRYAGKPVEFGWRIALLDKSGIPVSKAQVEWFYRRSGLVMRSPFMLSSGWFEAGQKEFLAPNAVAEAARDFGVTDDRARVAIATAALRNGQRVLNGKIAAAVAAKASALDAKKLLARSQSPSVEKRVRASTAEFHALQVTQRPTFVLTSSIGDCAVFSGLAKAAPIAAAVDAMLEDAAAYASHAAHVGDPPSH